MLLIRFAIFLSLFTAVTKIFNVWAVGLGLMSGSVVSIAVVTAIFFCLNCFVLLSLYLVKEDLTLKRWGIPVILFVLVGPLVSTLFAMSFDARAIVLNFLYLTYIFLSCYFLRRDRPKALAFFTVCLLFTCAAGAASVFFPEFFRRYAELANRSEHYNGRAFGFYLQPNCLCVAVLITYLSVTLVDKSHKWTVLLYPVVLVTVVLSASRAGMGGMGIISVIFVARILVSSAAARATALRILPFFVTLFLIAISVFLLVRTDERLTYISERFDSLLLFSSDFSEIQEDRSMISRLDAQAEYWHMIKKRPIFGHGYGARTRLTEAKVLILTSHNAYLEILMEGGLVYFSTFLIFVFCLFQNYFWSRKHRSHDISLLMSFEAFLAFMFFISFFDPSFFQHRCVYVFLGLLIARQTEPAPRRTKPHTHPSPKRSRRNNVNNYFAGLIV